jgi:hypothetical protein
MHLDIPGALRDLSRLVDRIAELIEWEKLARQERCPHVPPSFQLPDHFREDIDQTDAWFWDLDNSIHEALDRPDLDASDEQRKRWKHSLGELEEHAVRLLYTAKLLSS